jgi:hypothetical protein
LLTHWRELFRFPPQLQHLQVFLEQKDVLTEGVAEKQETLVLKQDSVAVCTFKASDLELGTVSFVKKLCSNRLRTCMLVDVRPMLAASAGHGFSYLLMFDCENAASAVLARLRRSWCEPSSPASACSSAASAAETHASTGSPAASAAKTHASDSEGELEHLDSSGDEA